MIEGALTGFLGSQVRQSPAGGGLLLDRLPGASAAFSARKLRTGYNGSCLRLRRSADNAESDFGFLNGWLDTAAIASWLGASTGYVKVWYDQSPNAYNASQATNGAQPVVVSSVSSFGNRPGVQFVPARSTALVTETKAILRNVSTGTVSAVSAIASAPAVEYIVCIVRTGSGTSRANLSYKAAATVAGGRRLDSDSYAEASWASVPTGGASLVGSYDWSGAVARLYAGGSLQATKSPFQTGGSTSDTSTTLWLGHLDGVSRTLDGHIAELVVWGSSIDHAAIYADQKAAFGLP